MISDEHVACKKELNLGDWFEYYSFILPPPRILKKSEVWYYSNSFRRYFFLDLTIDGECKITNENDISYTERIRKDVIFRLHYQSRGGLGCFCDLVDFDSDSKRERIYPFGIELASKLLKDSENQDMFATLENVEIPFSDEEVMDAIKWGIRSDLTDHNVHSSDVVFEGDIKINRIKAVDVPYIHISVDNEKEEGRLFDLKEIIYALKYHCGYLLGYSFDESLVYDDDVKNAPKIKSPRKYKKVRKTFFDLLKDVEPQKPGVLGAYL